MSNIYVGGISFESGFASGFKRTPLQISNVEIASTTPTVVATSGITLSVLAATLDILPLALQDVTTTKNVNANTTTSVVNISSLDIQEVVISSNINTTTSTSTVDITSLDIQEVLIPSNIITTTSTVDITSLDIQEVVISSNVITSPSVVDILSLFPLDDVVTSSNVNVDASANTLDISSLDIQEVIISSNINVASSTVDILSLFPLDDVVTSSNINVTAQVNTVDISSLDINEVIISTNINTTATVVDILSLFPLDDVTTSSNVNVNVSLNTVDILSLDIQEVIISTNINATSTVDILSLDIQEVIISHNINVTSSVINISTNPASVIANSDILINATASIIDIKPVLISEVISSSNINTNVSLVKLITNGGSVVSTNNITVETITSKIDISSNLAAISFTQTVSVNVQTSIINLLITAPALEALSAGVSTLPQPSSIITSALSPIVNFGVGVISTPSLIAIRPRIIDGAGLKIPNWDDSDTSIDNQFWDSGSSCKDNESNFFNGLINNAFDMYGVDAVWYPVDYSLNNEKIYGEDNSRTVLRNFRIKYYLEDLNSAASDNQQFNKWGIEGLDNFEIYISKTAYEQASQLNMNGNIASRPYLPKPGDIMRSEHLGVYYEVVEIKDKTELFLQRSHSWTMTLRPITNKHYIYDPSLNGDDIITALQTTDVLGQNDYIDTQTSAVMYNDQLNPNDDPFNLFD